MKWRIRHAEMADIPELTRLIARSARELSRADYSAEQIEGALGSAWGVDSQLIRDRTYFVVEDAGMRVGCGGWSRRKALFGADALSAGEPELLDPLREAARIRAFFIHPEYARRGIGRALLEKCEAEARLGFFRAAELIATLPGKRLYEACGYIAQAPIYFPLPNGASITFVPMRKETL